MDRLVIRLSHGLALIAALALALMMLHVTADVIGKYLFNAPVPGTAEIVASYYMVAAVFLPLAWVEVRGGSIVVELLYDIAPKSLQHVMAGLGAILSTLFYGILAWLSWAPAMHAYEIGEVVEGTWRVTVWPTKFLLPAGLALACIITALQLVRILMGRDSLIVEGGSAPRDPV
jgi:TRAP-type C4-dicarboxylate transport system permease small subunit